MITIDDSIIIDEILTHVATQRVRAKLVDQPFELGVVTDQRPSQILELVHSNEASFKEIGMTKFQWHDDALRSEMKLAGEELLFSISHKRM